MFLVFGILAGAVGLFAWGRPRADVVAILVVLALMLTRVLTPKEALAGFGDPVVILIAALFIVGESLVNTGVVHRLGEAVLKAGGGHETRLILLVMGLAGGIGAFMSTSAVVAMFIPVVMAIARKTGLDRKRLLMPLSVAALNSGMMTLIASSPNMIVENTLRSHGLPPLSFFSWTPFGVAALATSAAFMLAARRLLSPRRIAESDTSSTPGVADLLGSYGLAEHWHRLGISEGSPLLHQSLARLQPLWQRFGVVLAGIEKHPRGRSQFRPALPEAVLEPDDAILAILGRDEAAQFIDEHRLRQLPRMDERQQYEALQDIGAAEIMLAPDSRFIGKTLGDLEFPSRDRVNVLAVRHRGVALPANLAQEPLDFGDSMLVAGDWADIGRMWEDRGNFLVLTLPAEYHERLPARRKLPVALGILVAMVASMATGLVPNAAAALLAALGMIASGCIKLEAIYRVISWKTVVLIAGMLPLATALTKTGATVLMAHGLVSALGALGPIAMLVVVFLVTAVVGLFLSNSATAVLIAPIAIQAAQALHVSPRAFAMTVAIACCAAYVTPVSSPVNMLVMEPGGYRFGDFVKVGLPLLLVTMAVTVALVTLIYPLH